MSIDVKFLNEKGQVSSNIYITTEVYARNARLVCLWKSIALSHTTLREQTRKHTITSTDAENAVYCESATAANMPHTTAFDKSCSQSRWRHSANQSRAELPRWEDACKRSAAEPHKMGTKWTPSPRWGARHGWPLSPLPSARPRPSQQREEFNGNRKRRSQGVLIHRWRSCLPNKS